MPASPQRKLTLSESMNVARDSGGEPPTVLNIPWPPPQRDFSTSGPIQMDRKLISSNFARRTPASASFLVRRSVDVFHP